MLWNHAAKSSSINEDNHKKVKTESWQEFIDLSIYSFCQEWIISNNISNKNETNLFTHLWNLQLISFEIFNHIGHMLGWLKLI